MYQLTLHAFCLVENLESVHMIYVINEVARKLKPVIFRVVLLFVLSLVYKPTCTILGNSL